MRELLPDNHRSALTEGKAMTQFTLMSCSCNSAHFAVNYHGLNILQETELRAERLSGAGPR